jgi:hypothetical protein
MTKARHWIDKASWHLVRRPKLRLDAFRNRYRDSRAVFSDVYRNGSWGSDGPFCSGPGSRDPQIISGYVAAIATLCQKPVRIVDLGCGDFAVGEKLLPLCQTYVGVDIVPELISHLRQSVTDARAQFECLDIVDAELPDGDLCLVRQVLQHLSNRQILRILPKLRKYPITLITEHVPSEGSLAMKNRDKVHGLDIRLARGSGVFLDAPPFSTLGLRVEPVHEVPGHPLSSGHDPGVIRTVKLCWPPSA